MLNIKDVLNVMPDIDYSGDLDVGFESLSFSFKKNNKHDFVVLMADDWDDTTKKRCGQYNKSTSDLIKELESKGSYNVVVSKNEYDDFLFKGFNALIVSNSKLFFYSLGRVARAQCSGNLIAVTGSAGKTTTKNMLAHVLKRIEDSKVSATQGNRNTARPVVNDVINSLDSDYIALEVSRACLNTFDEVGFTLRPDFAILTSISEAHLEDLGSLEGVAICKSKLFLDMSASGYVIINADTPYANLVVQEANKTAANVVTYGNGEDNQVFLVEYDSVTGMVVANVFGRQVEYFVSAHSEHYAINSLAVAAVLFLMDIPCWEELLSSLGSYVPSRGRGDFFKYTSLKRSYTIIDDSYNSNPASMRASLKSLSNIDSEGGRKIAVLGDMLELGENSYQLHADLYDVVVSSKVDKVYLVGEYMQDLWVKLPLDIKGALFPNVKGVYSFLRTQLKDNDLILFKSSNGTGLSRIVKRFRK